MIALKIILVILPSGHFWS